MFFFGVRKWSKDHNEVMPVPEQNSQPKHKNKQNTEKKTEQNNYKTQGRNMAWRL